MAHNEMIEAIMRFEGYTIEEARLTYAQRQNLPDSAFCGPNRTYPAHDAAHVRNAFARLATFGHRLPKSVRAKIYRCLRRRAKRFGVEHDPEHYRWKADGSPNPNWRRRVQETVKWFLKEYGIEK